MEKELRESQERYQLLVETSPDGVILLDMDGTVRFSNGQMAGLFHVDHPAELVGTSITSLFAPEERRLAVTEVLDVAELDVAVVTAAGGARSPEEQLRAGFGAYFRFVVDAEAGGGAGRPALDHHVGLAGEGVVVALLPPTPEDGQPRYRIRVFVDGRQTEGEIELVDGVLFEVPRFADRMSREERLNYHSGVTPPWNEEIGTG